VTARVSSEREEFNEHQTSDEAADVRRVSHAAAFL